MKVFTSHGFVTWKVWCVFVCEKKIIFQFQLMLEKEKLRNSRREGKVMHRQHTLVGFLHRGFFYTLVMILLTNNLLGGLSVRIYTERTGLCSVLQLSPSCVL